MCGRFTLTANAATLQQSMALGEVPDEVGGKYNVAPSQAVAVVTEPFERNVKLFRWGLIPSWAKDKKIGYRMINARAETVAQKPAFRVAFSRRRCIVLADGFYEWQRVSKKKKQPYYFRVAGLQPFAMAGLWETWHNPEEPEPLHSCTIITCAANERVAPIHERSPVILQGDTPWIWLDPHTSRAQLHDLLTPLPADKINLHPVSTLVNSPRHDSPSLIDKVAFL